MYLPAARLSQNAALKVNMHVDTYFLSVLRMRNWVVYALNAHAGDPLASIPSTDILSALECQIVLYANPSTPVL